MSNEEKVLQEIYSSFANRLDFEDFKRKFSSLPIDKWNFARAVSLYQQYLKCKDCSPNIATVVLCSCADALQLKGGKYYSRANFKEFYLKYCPPEYRRMPIEYLSREKRDSATIPFDERTLDYIYQEFRCSYIHVGIGCLELFPEKDHHHYHQSRIARFKKEKGFFEIDLVEFRKWFEKVTFESLYAFLLGKVVEEQR
jgi:hypothetical protein